MSELNEKQQRILEVAEQLFAEKGFDGTSIRNISKEARINIAMVSYYFGSKERMLEALILYRSSDMKLQLENLVKQELAPNEKLDRLIELYIERVNRNRCIYQILHFEFSSKKRELDMKSFMDVKRKNMGYFTQIIEEGQQKGVFRKDLNIILLPPTILGTFFHFRMNRKLYEEVLGLDTEEKFEAYVKNELTVHIKQTIKALITL